MPFRLIYLLRHGETVWNREDRIQGQLDAPLTERGVEQARRMGRALRQLIEDDGPFKLITSPLGRARRTADLVLEHVGACVSEVATDERLMEMSWGRWEGLVREQIMTRDPERWRRFEADSWTVSPTGGESYGDLAARARDWLEGLDGEDRLIVVAHGGFGRVLRAHYLGLPPAAALALKAPQDALYRLEAGTVAEIPTDDGLPK